MKAKMFYLECTRHTEELNKFLASVKLARPIETIANSKIVVVYYDEG